jgi:hypothetical protein
VILVQAGGSGNKQEVTEMLEAHELRRPDERVRALAAAAAVAVAGLAGLAGYQLRGATHSSSVEAPRTVSATIDLIWANPVLIACEDYSCTLEGETELRERQAVEAALAARTMAAPVADSDQVREGLVPPGR